MRLYLILFLLSFSAYADPYLDLGISYHDMDFDSFVQNTGKPVTPLIGEIEAGYEFNNISLFFRHSSSIEQKDRGLNIIGVKIRVFGK